MASDEFVLPPEVLIHICIYCHEDKGSAKAANECEVSHERTMPFSERQERHAAYNRKFLRPKKSKGKK